jgi:hypothetical protein
VKPAEVKRNMRQSGEYRLAVNAIKDGDIADGFKRLDDLGWIREIASDDRDRQLRGRLRRFGLEGPNGPGDFSDARRRGSDHRGNSPRPNAATR